MADHDKRPRMACVYFGDATSPYGRMARVLRYTAARHCPAWDLDIRGISPVSLASAIGPRQGGSQFRVCVANAQKFEEWWRTIADASVGDRVLLIDADTFITNSLDDVWDRDFDIAYTTRDFHLPVNCGVVFVRVTPESKAFMDRWRDATIRMVGDREHHLEWHQKFGGMTQASFGYVITHERGGENLVTLPCAEWNSEDSAWHLFDPDTTRIVHVKSELRQHIFQRPSDPGAPPIAGESRFIGLAERWYALEQEAELRP
jgi:hypothetical protein